MAKNQEKVKKLKFSIGLIFIKKKGGGKNILKMT